MPQFLSNKTIEKLKYDLVRENIVSYDNLFEAEKFAEENKTNVGYALISLGFIEENKILKFLEKKLRIPYVDLTDYQLDKNSLKYIKAEDAEKYNTIPLFKIENVLTIAMSDPLNLFMINNILKSNNLNIQVEPVICSENCIKDAIETYYAQEQTEAETQEQTWQQDLFSENNYDFKSIINKILQDAINNENEYIFMENSKNGLDIFLDKQLKGYVPLLLIPRFVSEFKTISNLDIHETDLPQLGRYELSFNNKLYCFIISTYPCFNGEKIAINVYQPPKSINNYGMSENDLNKLFSALDETGIIQIKGGQNSGKTLFIYSLLSNIENKRIITLESKIKYAINSATQCEINNDVGFNLKTALDYLNFQNPDIVYIENIFSIEDFELIKKLSNLKTVIIETNLAIRNVNCKILINNGMAEIETQTPDLSLVSA